MTKDTPLQSPTSHDPQAATSGQALDNIIRDNTPRLQSFVRSRVSNRDDADDIVQDTFYQLLRTISIMNNPVSHITSWLYTVAHNLVINHGKKHREDELPNLAHSSDADNDFMADLSDILIASDDDNPEMQMLRSMVWEELDKALNELPREQREAVEMTEIQGLSVKDAAAAMGVSVGTFLSRKHYAVTIIRRRLRALYEELTQS